MIGAGYVGLVSAVCFSEFGWTVNCVDKDPDKIAALKAGQIPIYEPGLEELLARNAEKGRINFFTDLAAAVQNTDLIFLAVGTPMRRGDGYADLSYVYQSRRRDRAASHRLHGHHHEIDRAGRHQPRDRAAAARRCRPDADFAVCSNPEFLREGSAIRDFTHPDRVLVGVDDDARPPGDGARL